MTLGKRIWYLSKHLWNNSLSTYLGDSYVTITGSVKLEELKKVAESVQ